MSSYLTLAEFKTRSLMPASTIDDVETASAGWILIQLDDFSRWIDSRLAKRYAAPFATPYPTVVLAWLARLVTVRVYLKRGVDANDAQFARIEADADLAMKEIAEAADSVTGLYDLPLRQDTTASGISKGGPRGSSEASPYVFMDIQRDRGRDEDRNGTGTSDA